MLNIQLVKAWRQVWLNKGRSLLIVTSIAMSTFTLGLILVLFLFGFAKAGLMPFHGWLPAAMVAPTPVSAFLHGVAVVKDAGEFLLIVVSADDWNRRDSGCGWHPQRAERGYQATSRCIA